MATIDTLKYYEELVAGGISDKQAKVQIYTLEKALNNLGTKEDLRIVEKDLKHFFVMSIVGFIYAPLAIAWLIKHLP